jgi:amino acid permease
MFLEPIPVFFFILVFLLCLPTFFPYFLDSELAFLVVVIGLCCPFLSFTHDPIGILHIPIHLSVIFLFCSSFGYSRGMG